MDPFDQAQELEMATRNQAIAAQREKQSNAPSLNDCMDCGDAIPLERQALGGVCRCVTCQEITEKRRGQYGR